MPESIDNRKWRVNLTSAAIEQLQRARNDAPANDVAFLVVRHGSQWQDIFRLQAGEVSTIGRDDENHLVLQDDRCSRRHCQVFFETDRWFVRDLASRNGTKLCGKKLDGDRALMEADVIRIGRTEILFTHDISQRLNVGETDSLDSGTPPKDSDPQILERAAISRYFTEGKADPDGIRTAFANLYQLVSDIVSASNPQELANRVLDGLLPALGADIGAVLLFPADDVDCTDPDNLRITAYRAPEKTPYHKVSRRLSQAALDEKQALLAIDIASSAQEEFKTLHALDAESVICAPLRHGENTIGLLHLYSRDAEEPFSADSLQFALAVADQMAGSLINLNQQQILADGLQHAREQNRILQKLLESESDLVGVSPAMQRLRDTISRVARSDATVLVRGESGVGKELVARAVHFNSGRRDQPLVCLNCAALSESLLESELFGHEKGAFTGATETTVGKFEQANGGTLFLDEVGEMPLSIQAKFLRALEGHAFERVGGNQSIEANVRVVAATNRNLEEAVKNGEFRSDLFYRLQILEILVPPLRERRDDVILLADHFLTRACERMSLPPIELAPSAQRRLSEYDWPGNIRELRNVIERGVVLCDGSEILADNVQLSSAPAIESAASVFYPTSLENVEKRHIERTLEYTSWKKREASRLLGINRSTLDRKLERYGIEPRTND